MPSINPLPPISIDREDLSTQKAANYLGRSEFKLRDWRIKRRGPPFYISRLHEVLYRKADLDRWLETRTVKPDEEFDRDPFAAFGLGSLRSS